MPSAQALDDVDVRLLLALREDPRATVVALAEKVGLSRNTVQSRLAKLEPRLGSFERRIDPASLGYPLSAFITVRVTQQMLDALADSMAEIPEVVEVFGLTGESDLLVRVVAVDADDLYRIAGQILNTPGVERTHFSLSMHTLVDFRLTPLMRRAVEDA
ncbi:Lrp/AsnC family transcriptional regulator [Saccharopolyspora halophila]|uniref:Lrp/AsnC family transcriptional regulator n=1 Tax=Saccharopolyspora halophila TaxID=405551 RepID=A0ABP5TUL8_9PSEU